MAGLPPVPRHAVHQQATLIVVRGCHVILTSRASPAPRKRRPDAPLSQTPWRAWRLSDSGVRAGQPISALEWRCPQPRSANGRLSRVYSGVGEETRSGDAPCRSRTFRGFPDAAGVAPGCSGME